MITLLISLVKISSTLDEQDLEKLFKQMCVKVLSEWTRSPTLSALSLPLVGKCSRCFFPYMQPSHGFALLSCPGSRLVSLTAFHLIVLATSLQLHVQSVDGEGIRTLLTLL
jgi:hypothetical protein